MKKVVVYIIITATVFATMEVVLKIGGNNLNAFQLTGWRFLIGGLFLAPFAWAESSKRGYRLNWKDFGWLVCVGTMGITISMMAFQFAVVKCNAATASVMFCTNPLFAMLIAHAFTSEKMDTRKWIAFGLGLIAIFFMVRPWDIQEGNTAIGMLIMMISSVTFGAFSVMGKRSIARIGTFTQTSINFVVSSVMVLIIAGLMGQPVFGGIIENLWLVLYIGFIVTGLGYMFYFLAIRHSDATTASITFFIKPAIAPVFAVIILHETVYWNTILGVILLITASVITIADTAIRTGVGSLSPKSADHLLQGEITHDREE